MSAYGHGRHEHGQNFLTDHKIINSIIDLVKQTSGPIIEIGPGSGALTHPMAYLGRAITAVEVDAKLAAKLTQETSSAAVEVVHDDFLNFRLPATPCVIVGNIPFHLTTAILRKLLHAPAWTEAARSARHRGRGAQGAWAEVLDLLVLLGVRPGRATAAPDVAARLDRYLSTPGPVAQRVAVAAERCAFGPPGTRDAQVWSTVRVLRRRARARLPWWRRVSFAVDPRPLLRRRSAR